MRQKKNQIEGSMERCEHRTECRENKVKEEEVEEEEEGLKGEEEVKEEEE